MASSVFSETLQVITTTKLTELSKKRALFEKSKSSVLSSAQREVDQKERLRILLDGVKRCFSIKTTRRKRGHGRASPGLISTTPEGRDLEMLLKNLEHFLGQARYDPSVSPKLLQDWEKSLMQRLNVQTLKYQYATLYGELVNEWLVAEKSIAATDNASETPEGFEKIHRAERDESRINWEHLVFEPMETDQVAISEYLRALFSSSIESSKALDELWKSVSSFEVSMSSSNQFNHDVLTWTINGLLASGLLSNEKNAVLKDFLASPVILTEVADVLNMRIASIQTWSWETEVSVEQRRHVTGAYHIYIDEDLLQAIFLQYIGVKWSVFFKQAFTKFSNYDGAWASLRDPIPNVQKMRREYFLGHQRIKPSVQSKRQGVYKSIFFMSQLPDSPHVESSSVEGEEEVNYDTRPAKRFKSTADFGPATVAYQQQALMAPQQAPSMMMQALPRMGQNAQGIAHPGAPPRGGRAGFGGHAGYHNHQATSLSSTNGEYDLIDPDTKPKSSMDTKQFLLHFLSSELLLGTRLHGDFTCTRSEFSFWSPSLPHSTIRSVLSFFKLSKNWLGFFHRFLEAPLKFIEDGPSASTRPRKRGVPGAHALSSVCGEAILFCMDYAVNQHTNGAQLYRMHDDFWIWSSNHETVVKGWEAITKFADVMGVTLNKGKTGTVRIMKDPKEKEPATLDPSVLSPNKGKAKSTPVMSVQKEPAPIHPTLPIGEIRWGFLYMDPLTGKFVIDQDMVDQHILELQRQLQEKDKSIFSWIQAWNTYAGTFFRTNFGKPANIFGREHVDMILSTMTRIQKQIFSDSNVVEYLKGKIHERFGIEDIPDGYLYFPTSLGGLELQNPFIGLVQVRDAVFEQPTTIIDDFLDAEIEAYRKTKLAWEKGQANRYSSAFDKFDMGSWPDDGSKFMTFEEFTRYREEFAYDYEGNLLSNFDDLLEQPGPEEVNFTVTDKLDLGDVDDGYMRWVAQLYGQDMIERFGGLNIVEKGLLPMGMVTLFRSGRVKWQE